MKHKNNFQCISRMRKVHQTTSHQLIGHNRLQMVARPMIWNRPNWTESKYVWSLNVTRDSSGRGPPSDADQRDPGWSLSGTDSQHTVRNCIDDAKRLVYDNLC